MAESRYEALFKLASGGMATVRSAKPATGGAVRPAASGKASAAATANDGPPPNPYN